MGSQVKSQLTDKVYESTLDDLYELDQGLEVDLYKLNVFNKDIMIAPGKVMTDVKKDVHYCYVYVIKDGKVAAKLGIYETQVKRDEVYDLTDFEGREFLLFDYYYNEPGSLVEFEMKEAEDNIFDYLKRFIKPTDNATATIKEQASQIKKIAKKLGESEYTEVLKLFKKQKPYDEDWLDSFKEEQDNWMIILIILEVIFDVKFIFQDSDGSENELREMVRSRPNQSTTLITVSLEETPRHIVVPKKSAKSAKYTVESESESESDDDGPVGEYKEGMDEEKAEPKPSKAEPKTSKSAPIEAEPKTSKSAPIEAEPKPSKAEPEAKSPRSFSSKPKPPPEPEAKSPRSFSSKPKPPPEPEATPRSFSSKSKPGPSKNLAAALEPEPIKILDPVLDPEPSEASEAAEVVPFRKIPSGLKPKPRIKTRVPPPPKNSPKDSKNNA